MIDFHYVAFRYSGFWSDLEHRDIFGIFDSMSECLRSCSASQYEKFKIFCYPGCSGDSYFNWQPSGEVPEPIEVFDFSN